MAKLFDLEKADNDFVESMLFPMKRRAAIDNLSKIRKYQWGATIFLSVLWLIWALLSDSASESGAIVLCLAAISASYTDARIKMLKTFQRMESLQKADSE